MAAKFVGKSRLTRAVSTIFSLAIVAIMVSGCAQSRISGHAGGIKSSNHYSPRVANPSQRIAKGGGYYKLGNPYTIRNRRYVPKVEPQYDKIGVASWYGEKFHGRLTANGEVYDMNALTAAHKTFPLPSYAEVTNLETGKKIVVRVNDRGPYARDRIIDMSKRTASILGFQGQGTARVRVKYLGRAPLNGDDTRERTFLKYGS